MIVLEVLLVLLTLISIGFYIASALGVIGFQRPSPIEPPSQRLGVSLIVPVCGEEPSAYENWASLCQQDYENYEVLFGILDPQDPAVPIVKQVIEEMQGKCNAQRLELHFCTEVLGICHKISNLIQLLAIAQYDTIVFADSDIRVTPDYLATVTTPLDDPEVGMVTCGFLDHHPASLGAALGSMGRCIDFIPSVTVAQYLDQGLRFAIGPTIATRRQVLADIGGLETQLSRIGSDYHLGKLTAEAGYQVIFSPYILENDCGQEKVSTVFQRELRWARTIRFNRGLQYYGLSICYGTICSLLVVLVSGFASWAIILAFSAWLVRYLQALISIWQLKSPGLLPWLWTLPLRDLMSFVIWVVGCFGRRISWRGQRFNVAAEGVISPIRS
jgi:ceramide glucosyltransferase